MKFYAQLENILLQADYKAKIKSFENFYERYKNGDFSFEKKYEKKLFDSPSYGAFCKIVPPQEVPKRKNLTTKEGQIYLLHAIAHIEYSAIDLALDAAYRFADMPKEYYDDWLEVADDEIRHFLMIEKLLTEAGGHYGDVEVHDALFEAMQRTSHSLLERMAVVPRYLEANGLDATPAILKKLQKLPKSEILERIIKSLQIIVDEEISHVQKGDRWFSYACVQEGKEKESYFAIIDKYYPLWLGKKKELNVEARKEAGFSCGELKRIAHSDVC
ncbi:ferritin-like domain-containing protein [Sulfurimonas sp. HSL-1716]|uniref:ferritin-like domain-containing protein n=1 Tax=Hydrocurvibacter sulfurireducens TaxID=3131937 RepID=UPI0031F923B1